MATVPHKPRAHDEGHNTGFDKASANRGAAPAGASTLEGFTAPGPGQCHQSTERALKLPGQPRPGLRPRQGMALRPGGSAGAVEPWHNTMSAVPGCHIRDQLDAGKASCRDEPKEFPAKGPGTCQQLSCLLGCAGLVGPHTLCWNIATAHVDA